MKYIIFKGQHYSFGWRKLFTIKNEIGYMVNFNISTKYNHTEHKCIGDWNKLFGLNCHFGRPHKNSARFVWRCLNNELQLGYYSYLNNERKNNIIMVANTGIDYKLRIVITDKAFNYYVDGRLVRSELLNGTRSKFIKYPLYPYFGGNCSAPHKIRIDLD